MTDAPKIDTQAPKRICTWDTTTHEDGEVMPRGWTTSYSPGDPREYIRADLSAAREAAAVERAFRDGLTYGTICEVTDQDEAWRTSQARGRLADTTALDRLIAERVREAVEGVSKLFEGCASSLVPADYAQGYREALEHVLDAVRASKEGR